MVQPLEGSFGGNLNINQVYEQFAAELKKLVDFDRVYIHIVHAEADTFTIKYLFGQDAPDRFVGAVVSMAGTRTERVVKTGHTLISPADPRNGQFLGDHNYFQAGLVSSIGVPLISKGQPIGALFLRSQRMEAYGPREQAILERLANQIAPAVDNARLFEQTRQAEAALRESEQRIRELATESVRAHEEERQWSALEVHDRIAQPLAAAFHQLQTLKDRAGADPAARKGT